MTGWGSTPQSLDVFLIRLPEIFGSPRLNHPVGKKITLSQNYTTWKVDGATPMNWFIMAPY